MMAGFYALARGGSGSPRPGPVTRASRRSRRAAFLRPALLATTPRAATGAEPDPLRRVDPMIGTDFFGHTYPGPGVPFGMVQLSSDPGTRGWAWASGYALYDYAGQPWKTQRCVREVMERLYRTGPGGLCGNEDMGSTSLEGGSRE